MERMTKLIKDIQTAEGRLKVLIEHRQSDPTIEIKVLKKEQDIEQYAFKMNSTIQHFESQEQQILQKIQVEEEWLELQKRKAMAKIEAHKAKLIPIQRYKQNWVEKKEKDPILIIKQKELVVLKRQQNESYLGKEGIRLKQSIDAMMAEKERVREQLNTMDQDMFRAEREQCQKDSEELRRKVGMALESEAEDDDEVDGRCAECKFVGGHWHDCSEYDSWKRKLEGDDDDDESDDGDDDESSSDDDDDGSDDDASSSDDEAPPPPKVAPAPPKRILKRKV